ncbi:LOW QUALITY PROTEIN: hypothetical protein SORBI_3010G107250 [Sorghum bicolor]|uniref:Uncharacterized protein n=1 Tax=Sorghum bicolor TaxID=4558 RepID=A0A1W0VSG9_SORBI|nr:LOW QUALITY PROTEIN: hypothetical protein SORBI_3010G107250 [Sorghum bicolor]
MAASDISHLPYLQAIVKRTRTLHPTVEATVEVQGCRIPEGTTVYVNISTHPFGAGRRICLTLPLADRMLDLTVASLLHRFHGQLLMMMAEVGGGDGGVGIDMAECFGLVLSMATPLRAVAKEVV